MKKILITGSSGFIAKHFIKKFQSKYEFILYDRKKNGDLGVKVDMVEFIIKASYKR